MSDGTRPLPGSDPELDYLILSVTMPGEGAMSAFCAVSARLDREADLVRVDLGSSGTALWVRTGTTPIASAEREIILLGELWDRSGTVATGRDLDALASMMPSVAASALIERYWGRYLALFPSAPGGPLLLRDPIGHRQAYRTHHDGLAIVTPALPAWLVEAAGLILAPDIARIGRLLADPRSAVQQALLDGVEIVPAARLAALDGSLTGPALWNPAMIVRRASACSIEVARDRLRDAVDRVCLAISDAHPQLVVQLSGGLDSAIVLGSLARLRERSTVGAVNLATPFREGDERALARSAAVAAGIELHAELADPERMDIASLAATAHPLVPRLYGLDPHQEAIVGDYAASRGASAIVTGQGGDAVLYALAYPENAVDAARDRAAPADFAWITAQRCGCSIWRIWAMQWRDRFGAGGRAMPDAFDSSLLSGEARYGVACAPIVHPWTEATYDLGPAKRIQIDAIANSQIFFLPTLRQRRAALIHPFLTQPVIEACLALPIHQLAPDLRDRGLARDAFVGRIPATIRNRTGKGEASRYSNLAIASHLDFIRPFLLDGCLAEAGLLDRAALDAALTPEALLSGRHARHPLFYVGVEAWLRQWR